MMNNLGNGVAYLLGPYLVPDNFLNDTNAAPIGNQSDVPSRADIRQDIQWYMVGQAAVACALFLTILAYFPAKPPTPPSPSSSAQRTDYKEGLKALVTNRLIALQCVKGFNVLSSRNIWLCMMGYCLPTGIAGAWASVIVLNFKSLGIDDHEAGLIGVFATVAGTVVGVAFGFATDRIRKHIKVKLI